MNNYQRKLFPYAYNILGSIDDVMDAIQDVMVKYVSAPKQGVENETGYLIKAVINQSINIKKRNKKIAGDTMWLPEPIATEKADANINRREIISYSMLFLLEYLNPKERAVFILKEAFDYSHEEIAGTLSISIENSRKLLSRAKNELKTKDRKFSDFKKAISGSLQGYISILENGDVKSLEKMLSTDIAVMTDGGPEIKIVSELTVGVKATAALMMYVYKTYQKTLSILPAIINHQPALIFYDGNTLINCQVFEFEEGAKKISHIYSIVDPEKLKNIHKP
ncbi:MAG: sigma-70 family RNA polymerase sigma factor [Rhizobacter sp.]|nr:sigma-70 family RNA polymerase sigma factor [Ferruginibacter sp.]